MSEHTNTLFGRRYATRGDSCRLTRAEFGNQVHPYVEYLTATKDNLQALKNLIASGESILPSICQDTIERLIGTCEHSRKLYAFVAHSEHLPLSVIPLCLPLLIALKDVETHTTKLNHLLEIIRDEGWLALYRSSQRLLELRKTIDILRSKIEEVSDQVSILLDRARFKEHEYSTTYKVPITNK